MQEFCPTAINTVLASHFSKRRRESNKTDNPNRALFLTWENAPKDELDELYSVLEESYNFEGDIFEIPLKNSETCLRAKLQSLIDFTPAASSMILVAYIGGGEIKKNRQYWKPRDNQGVVEKPGIDWFHLQETLERCASDITLIIDCSYGRNFHRNAYASVGRLGKKMEILASIDPLPIHYDSLTRSIAKELKCFKGKRITLNRLSSKLVFTGEARIRNPCYLTLSKPELSSIELTRSFADQNKLVPLELPLKMPLDELVITDLQKWVYNAPASIMAAKFNPLTGAVPGGRLNQLTEFGTTTLILSLENTEVLEQEDFLGWIGKKKPPCLGNIRHSPPTPTTKLSSKSPNDESLNRKLEVIASNWNQEGQWQRAQATNTGRYKRVVVLPLVWEVTGFDGNQLEYEVKELATLFERDFDFEVKELFRIPFGRSLSSEQALRNEISALISPRNSDALGREDLLIIIYSGHGVNTAMTNFDSIWASGERHPEPKGKLNWSKIIPDLNASNCDVFQILDCCHAATAAKADENGRNEIFAACVRENETFAGAGSFTNIVIRVLKRLVLKGNPFTTEQLHNEVDTETPRQNRTKQYPRAQTPFYKRLDTNIPPIVLRPRTANQAISSIDSLSNPKAREKTYLYAKVEVVDMKEQGDILFLTREQLQQELSLS